MHTIKIKKRINKLKVCSLSFITDCIEKEK